MRKILISLLISAFLGALFSSCGSKPETVIPDKTAAMTAGATTAGAKPVSIKFMHWWSYVDENILNEFEKDNPNIQVNMDYTAIANYPTKIRMLSSSNSLPDVFGIQNAEFVDFAKQSLLMDLKDELKTPAYGETTSWGGTLQPSLMENLNSLLPQDLIAGSQQYGVPFGATAACVVYNKTIFDKVGIKKPATWDEFMSNNEKLKAAGYIPMSFVGKVGWKSWWYKLALDQTMRDVTPEDFVSGKVKMDDPRVIEAFQVVKDMWDKGYFDPGGFTNGIEETQALFVQGKLAQFFIVPENFVSYLIDNSPKDIELDAYMLPPMKGVTPNRVIGGASNILGVYSKTSNKDAAVKLAKFMTSDKLFKMLTPVNVVPSTIQKDAKASSPIMKVFADSTADGFMAIHLPTNLYKDVDDKIMNDLYPRMLLQNEPIDKLLQEVQQVLDKDIAAGK